MLPWSDAELRMQFDKSVREREAFRQRQLRPILVESAPSGVPRMVPAVGTTANGVRPQTGTEKKGGPGDGVGKWEFLSHLGGAGFRGNLSPENSDTPDRSAWNSVVGKQTDPAVAEMLGTPAIRPPLRSE